MAGRPTSRVNPGSAAHPHPRRNLFAGGATRRPASSSTATTGTTLLESSQDNVESDIVLRKADGNYTTIIPNIAPTDNDIAAEDDEGETEARLVALAKDRRQSNEPELLEILAASLRHKVASLEADKWVFEPDDATS